MSENENGTVFGIDLGTTYSCISYIDDTGNPIVAKNMDGDSTTPSVVSFEDDGSVVVGQVAKDSAVLYPDRTVQFVKILMGNSSVAKTIDGEDKSPEEISAYILRKVAEDATSTTGFEVKNVAITIPAYFGDAERKATQAAAEIAGLNILPNCIVQEPVAAAVYYGCTKGEDDQTVLVYDLGGGTFDVTVIKVSKSGENTDVQVVCSDGNHNLGGRNWDAAIIGRLQDDFRDETGFDDEFDEFSAQAFQTAAEKAKKQLTQKQEVKVPLNINGTPANITLSRQDFESLTSQFLEETLNLTQKVLDNAKSKGCEVQKILLVGGSTFMPQVTEGLNKRFPDLQCEINDPNEAVSKGAALVALDSAIRIIDEVSQGNSQVEGAEGATLTDGGATLPDGHVISLPGAIDVSAGGNLTIKLATTKSYGIEVIDNGNPMINNLILKNVSMEPGVPYTHKETFGTHVEGQTSVKITVYENDEEQELIEIAGRQPLSEAALDFGQPMPQGSPVECTFSLDANGILDILAYDPVTQKSLPIQIETDSLTDEQIQEIKSSALARNVE